MATLYSDIYIDGMNMEILAADGKQIKEAWLDRKCIWKLTEESNTRIYLVTYYDNMYYAIGSVENSHGEKVYCILAGKTLDKLSRYYSTTSVIKSLQYVGISVDSNGLFVEKPYTVPTGDAVIEIQMKKIEELVKNEGTQISLMFQDFASSGLSKNAYAYPNTDVCDSNRGILYAHYYLSGRTDLYRLRSVVDTIVSETHYYGNMHVIDSKLLLVLRGSTGLGWDYADGIYTYADYKEEKRMAFPVIKSMNMDFGGKNDIYYDLTKHYKEYMEELIEKHPGYENSLTIRLDAISSLNSACDGEIIIIEIIFTLKASDGTYHKKVLVEYKNGTILLEREISNINSVAGMLLCSVGNYFVYQYADIPGSDVEKICLMSNLNSYTDFSLPDGVFREYTNRFIRENKLCFSKQDNDEGLLDVYEVDLKSGNVEYIVYDVKSYDDLEE